MPVTTLTMPETQDMRIDYQALRHLFLYFGFTAFQLYLIHCESTKALGGGKNGRSLRKTA